MSHLNKINKFCKKAHLAKLSNFHKLLILINTNSTSFIFNIQPISLLIPKAEKIKKDLINKINYLFEKELISCSQLLINMIYKDRSHKDEILFLYLQKKAIKWILVNQEKSIIHSQ